MVASGPPVEALQSETQDVTPKDQHCGSDDVQPQTVKQRASHHDPDTGEHEQQTPQHAYPRKVDTPLPLVRNFSHSSHGMSMEPLTAPV